MFVMQCAQNHNRASLSHRCIHSSLEQRSHRREGSRQGQCWALSPVWELSEVLVETFNTHKSKISGCSTQV